MWKTLMVPLDGSPLAEKALDLACAMARASGAALHLVRVHSSVTVASYDAWGEWDMLAREEDERYLDSVRERLSEDGPPEVKTALLYGGFVPALCDYAAEREVDLVIMTTHGRTGLGRALRGSVADGLVRHAPVPVLLLPSRFPELVAQGELYGASAFRSVTVPLDGSEYAEEVLPHAIDVAKWSGARLILIRVVAPTTDEIVERTEHPSMPARIRYVSRTGELIAEAQEYLADVAAWLRTEHPGLHVEAHIRVGDRAAVEILETLHQHRGGIVALATHGRGASRLFVGSVADAVIRDALSPVLLYHPGSSPRGVARLSARGELVGSPAE